MNQDQYFKNIVTINGGSGVIVNPLTSDYSYVYTAKHVICIDSEDINSGLLSIEDITVRDYKDEPIEISEILAIDNSALDIAILRTSKQINSDVVISRKIISSCEKVRFCGYPERSRTAPVILERYRNHSYEFDVKYNEHIKLKTSMNIDFTWIVGMSGGGIFTDGNGVVLRAIETKYSGSSKEYDGCVVAVNIDKFDDIIHHVNESRTEKLSIVLPIELRSFQSLENLAFDFPDGWDQPNLLNNIRRLLIRIGQTNVTEIGITPISVKEELEHILECEFYENFEVSEPKYWAAFFELIVISVMVDEPETFDKAYLNNILNRRRIIYINSDKTWQKHLLSIFDNEYIDHDEDGFFIVKTNSPSQRVKYGSESISSMYINQVNNSDDYQNIDNVENNKNLRKTLIDLDALNNKCIYDQQDDLEGFNIVNGSKDIKEIIKSNYTKYLMS
ncbi:ABC-three component system protein [Vibrio harveyi]|uniref:ABC-three component system protein n=1 Tax=Vibrio harveyi TaxID=669 RepID=UPI003CFB5467